MNAIPELLKPVIGIIVYKSDSTAYLEQHTIRKIKDNQFTFGSAKPMKVKTIGKILNTIKGADLNQYTFKSLIPDNVLSYNIEDQEINLIWKVKSTIRKLIFDKSLNISNKEKITPHLIFKLKGKRLYVYSVKTYNIKIDSKLYYAPFHNIYENGNVCMGNVKINFNLKYIDDLINDIENKFFNSKFTHLNHKLFKNNINVLWNRNSFKIKDNLTRYNKNLKDIL